MVVAESYVEYVQHQMGQIGKTVRPKLLHSYWHFKCRTTYCRGEYEDIIPKLIECENADIHLELKQKTRKNIFMNSPK
jgi:hypothetical protein